MSKKKIIINSSIFVLATVLLLILGTFYDLSISKALCILPSGEYFCTNFFTAFFEIFGEAVLFVLIVVAFAIIYNYVSKCTFKKQSLKIFLQIVFWVLGALFSVFLFYKTTSNYLNYASENFKNFLNYFQPKLLIVILAVILELMIFSLFKKTPKENLQNLLKWAILILCVALISNGLVKVLKIIFKRTRYRAMLFVDDTQFSYYTNWFVVNKNTFSSLFSFTEDFFKSFPSGHACAAASIFCLCLLPKYLNKFNTKNWKISFAAISIVYTVIVCLTRILAGAHFFTDVFIGTLITIVSIFVVDLVVTYLFNKHKGNEIVNRYKTQQKTKKEQ